MALGHTSDLNSRTSETSNKSGGCHERGPQGKQTQVSFFTAASDGSPPALVEFWRSDEAPSKELVQEHVPPRPKRRGTQIEEEQTPTHKEEMDSQKGD